MAETSIYEELVGEGLFVRTVTYHLVGKVKRVVAGVMELEGASWVADSGRFGAAIAKGTLSEVEYVGTAYVNTASITDAFPWPHALPSQSK
jgi:hypothetical protein